MFVCLLQPLRVGGSLNAVLLVWNVNNDSCQGWELQAAQAASFTHTILHYNAEVTLVPLVSQNNVSQLGVMNNDDTDSSVFTV